MEEKTVCECRRIYGRSKINYLLDPLIVTTLVQSKVEHKPSNRTEIESELL